MNLQIIFSLILIGILAGVLSGLVGVGGGIIMVPLLVLFFGFTQQEASIQYPSLYQIILEKQK